MTRPTHRDGWPARLLDRIVPEAALAWGTLTVESRKVTPAMRAAAVQAAINRYPGKLIHLPTRRGPFVKRRAVGGYPSSGRSARDLSPPPQGPGIGTRREDRP